MTNLHDNQKKFFCLLVYTCLHSSTFVYTRRHSSSDSSVFLEQIIFINVSIIILSIIWSPCRVELKRYLRLIKKYVPTNHKLTLDINEVINCITVFLVTCQLSPLTISAASSILDVWQSSGYASAVPHDHFIKSRIYIKACIYKVKLQAMVAEMLQKSNFLFYVLYLRFTIFCFYYIFHVYDICFNVYFISYLYLYHVFLFLLFISIFILFDFKFLW